MCGNARKRSGVGLSWGGMSLKCSGIYNLRQHWCSSYHSAYVHNSNVVTFFFVRIGIPGSILWFSRVTDLDTWFSHALAVPFCIYIFLQLLLTPFPLTILERCKESFVPDMHATYQIRCLNQYCSQIFLGKRLQNRYPR
jgi:hypothetical protein